MISIQRKIPVPFWKILIELVFVHSWSAFTVLRVKNAIKYWTLQFQTSQGKLEGRIKHQIQVVGRQGC